MRKHIKAWWSESKSYPNGSTFTRGQTLMFVSGTLLFLAALIFGSVAFFTWDIGHLIEEWKWTSTHTMNDVAQRNEDFLQSYGVWIIVAMVAITLGPKMIARLLSKIAPWMRRNVPDQGKHPD